jgi:anthranilate phosphoribosyltransferase
MSLISFLKNTLDQTLSLEDQKAFLLTSLEQLSAQDLAEAVRFFQSRQTFALSFPHAIDVCGTGGSKKDRINTSTLSALLLAAMGIPVAKHGNKAGSGRFGSFDLLEALEIDVTHPEKIFSREGIAFLYAPRFHPDFKQFSEARRAVGQPTFFNLLGPLLNPAGVQRQVIGTSFPDKMDLLAETCRLLGRERVFIVHGQDGLDEVTLNGPTDVVELRQGKLHRFTVSPEDFGLAPCSPEEISSPSIEFNRAFAEDFLKENGDTNRKGRHRDLVLVNTALALMLIDPKRGIPTRLRRP